MSSPSRLRRMLSLRDPLVRSVVVGLLSVGLAYLVVSAASAYLVRRAAEHRAVQQASKLGEQAARSLLVPLLRDDVSTGCGYGPSQLDQEEREALLQQVITVSDLERCRFAAEVHHGAVQDSIGVRFGLGGLVEDTEPPIREHVERWPNVWRWC